MPFNKSPSGSTAQSIWTPWRRPQANHKRECLFFSFLFILTLGYIAFAVVSWSLGFRDGWLANVLGIAAMGILGALRLAGVRLSRLITALQVLTLAQAFGITWLTGGIYSATISWLALAPLPALLAHTQLARMAGLATGWLMIVWLRIAGRRDGLADSAARPDPLAPDDGDPDFRHATGFVVSSEFGAQRTHATRTTAKKAAASTGQKTAANAATKRFVCGLGQP
jgi:hypothetical protein